VGRDQISILYLVLMCDGMLCISALFFWEDPAAYVHLLYTSISCIRLSLAPEQAAMRLPVGGKGSARDSLLGARDSFSGCALGVPCAHGRLDCCMSRGRKPITLTTTTGLGEAATMLWPEVPVPVV
jgi:hypothetical protein